MEMIFHKIHSVKPLSNYELEVRFKEGITKIYDMKPLIEKRKVFKPLQNLELFYKAKPILGGCAIQWNEKIDLSSEDFYYDGKPVQKPFDHLISLKDASEVWELDESTLRHAIKRKVFIPNEDVIKFGKQWVITREAMERVYGKPD